MVTNFAGVQKMLDPLNEDKKGKYDPSWFTVNISHYIIIFFYKKWYKMKKRVRIMMAASEKKNEKKHILHIELGHGG